MPKKIIAIGAGIALAAFSISPANAVAVNGVNWDITASSMDAVTGGDFGSYGLDQTAFNILPHDVDTFYEFDCNGTETTEPDGDVIRDCGAFIASGLTGIEWTGHIKVFGGDGGGTVARQVVSLKNTTAADIVIDYEYYLDTEETYDDGNGEGTIGTPDGDLIVEAGETWWAGTNDNKALEGIAFGTDGYARGDGGDYADDEGFGVVADDTLIDAEGFDEFYSWNDAGVTIPAGATINFVYFYLSIGAADWGSIAPLAYTDAEFNMGMAFFSNPATVLADPRLMEGIVGGAYNWGAVPPAVLAETGVDASGIAIGGALALVAGAGVYAVRRRRALV
jgi:hypothetical protein